MTSPNTTANASKGSRPTKIILWLIVILTIIFIIALVKFVGYKTSKPPASSTENAAAPAQTKAALSISVVSPQTLNWEKTLTANGTVAAWQEAVIGSELSGLRLTSVNVNVGDVVRKGQVLAELNADTVKADLAQSRALAVEAKAVLEEASANAQRIKTLQNTGAMSKQEAAQYQTNQQTAQARLDAALAKVDTDQLRLSHTKILSPDNGVVSTRTATVGSLAQSGQELFRLIQDQRLEWRAEVTASDLFNLKKGMQVNVFSPNPQHAIATGKIRMISPVINPDTSYGIVYVDLPASAAVSMGMFVKGEFEIGSAPALTLPQSAILLRDGFAYVFIVDNKQRVRQQKVSLGRRLGDRIEVLNLANNIQVAASGTGFLADGDLVKVAAKIEASPLTKQITSKE